MSVERLNAAVDRLISAVESAVEHIHQEPTESPDLAQAVSKVEDATNKLESRVPDSVPETTETTTVVPDETPTTTE